MYTIAILRFNHCSCLYKPIYGLYVGSTSKIPFRVIDNSPTGKIQSEKKKKQKKEQKTNCYMLNKFLTNWDTTCVPFLLVSNESKANKAISLLYALNLTDSIKPKLLQMYSTRATTATHGQ